MMEGELLKLSYTSQQINEENNSQSFLQKTGTFMVGE